MYTTVSKSGPKRNNYLAWQQGWLSGTRLTFQGAGDIGESSTGSPVLPGIVAGVIFKDRTTLAA